MNTPPHRQVRLCLSSRSVLLAAADGAFHTCSHPGVSLRRHLDGRPAGQVWVPQGETPDFADDEALIAALRTALIWESADWATGFP
jgi:hypothetical protein